MNGGAQFRKLVAHVCGEYQPMSIRVSHEPEGRAPDFLAHVKLDDFEYMIAVVPTNLEDEVDRPSNE